MNKCIVFFIALILILAVAVITDNDSKKPHENIVVEHKADSNVARTMVENKTVSNRRF